MPTNASTAIRFILEANQVALNETQWHLMEKWVAFLLETNQKLNLVSRKDTPQIWEKHILHSLALLTVRTIEPDTEVCDLGTGGGLPGVPLAIACPHAHFTLIDATKKKIKALQAMLTALAIPNVCAVSGRAEELGKQASYQNRFSIFTAKAVAPLQLLEHWTRRLRTTPAVLHAYKGGTLQDEVQAISVCQTVKSITQTLLELENAPQFADNQKQIISLHF